LVNISVREVFRPTKHDTIIRKNKIRNQLWLIEKDFLKWPNGMRRTLFSFR